MSYRLIDANALAANYKQVNDMPCIYADLPNGLDGGYYDLARAERTCEFVDDSDSESSPPKCSVCGYDPGIYECAWYEDGTYGYERNYCPNCGAKLVSE